MQAAAGMLDEVAVHPQLGDRELGQYRRQAATAHEKEQAPKAARAGAAQLAGAAAPVAAFLSVKFDPVPGQGTAPPTTARYDAEL